MLKHRLKTKDELIDKVEVISVAIPPNKGNFNDVLKSK